MICKICGTTVGDGETVCGFCGSPIKSAQANPEPKKTVSQNSLDDFDASFVTENESVKTETKKSASQDSYDNFDISADTGRKTSKTTYDEYSSDYGNMVQRKQKNGSGTHPAVYVVLGIIVVLLITIIVLLVVSSQKDETNNQNDTEDVISVITQNSGTEIEETEPVHEPEKIKISSYRAFQSDSTWYEAQQSAESAGGYLACINDREEFVQLCSKAEEKGINVFWVGAKRNVSEDWDNTLWLDGESITYTNWLPNEPTYVSEDGEAERFLMVFKVNGEWYYNDAIADVSQFYKGKMGYIVEIEEF